MQDPTDAGHDAGHDAGYVDAGSDAGTADAGTDAGMPSSTFQNIYDSIIMRRCGGSGSGYNCHLTTLDAGGDLSMPDPATALANLVNVPSRNVCWSDIRVVPFDAGVSAFYNVHLRDCFTPRHSVLLGNPPLDAGELGLIESWINSGAR